MMNFYQSIKIGFMDQKRSNKEIKADFEEVIVNVKFDTEWRKNRTNLLSSTPKRQSSKLHRKTCEIEGFEIGLVDVVTFT